MTEALADRALDSLRNLESTRSAALTTAVLTEAKVSYFATIEAYRPWASRPPTISAQSGPTTSSVT
jgi:hypothetical protein